MFLWKRSDHLSRPPHISKRICFTLTWSKIGFINLELSCWVQLVVVWVENNWSSTHSLIDNPVFLPEKNNATEVTKKFQNITIGGVFKKKIPSSWGNDQNFDSKRGWFNQPPVFSWGFQTLEVFLHAAFLHLWQPCFALRVWSLGEIGGKVAGCRHPVYAMPKTWISSVVGS